jgi:hypothetical protein
MTKRAVRRLAWVGVALTVVALGFGVTMRLLEPTPGVTEPNLRRIRDGMTLAEVEAIFGRPADVEGRGVSELGPGSWVTRGWRGQGWDASVWFAEDSGRVDGVYRYQGGIGLPLDEGGPLDRLRSLFGW